MESAWPSDGKLAMATLVRVRVPQACGGPPRTLPKCLLVDRADDGEALRHQIVAHGINMICPHRKGRCARPEQVATVPSPLESRTIRHERDPRRFHAFIHMACALMMLRQFGNHFSSHLVRVKLPAESYEEVTRQVGLCPWGGVSLGRGRIGFRWVGWLGCDRGE